MKICTFLLLFIFNGFSQAYNNNHITLNYKNVSIKTIFKSIEEQSIYKFAYKPNTIIETTKISSIAISQKDIQTVLTSLQKITPFNYKIVNNTIAVKINPNQITTSYQKLGALKGKIYDIETKEPLVGANVMIKKLNKGVSTNLQGDFSIQNIPEGNYAVEFSFLGYQRKMISIDIIKGNILEVTVFLKESTTNLEEVVLTPPKKSRYAPIKNSTEESLVSSIKSSGVILTGISNEQITRTLDIDAGEVVNRVPGVSLLNNFVVVRGMSPRYNVTMLNGMVTPSTEQDTRAFSYNLLPSSVIDKIEVYKSPSADLPGNFGGGVIKIKTKNSLTTRQFRAGYTQQYRVGSSLKEFTTYKGSKKDWYGGGLKDRELPDILLDPNYIKVKGTLNIPRGFPEFDQFPNEVSRIGKSLSAAKTPIASNGETDFRTFFNYYDSWKIGNIRINNLSLINYEKQRQFIRKELTFNAEEYIKDGNGNINIPGALNRVDSLSTERIRISGMQNFSININNDNNIDINTLFIRNAKDEVLNREGNKNIDDTNLLRKIFTYKYNLRDLFQGQIKGSHTFASHLIEWSIGMNRAYDNVPDLKRYRFDKKINSNIWFPVNSGENSIHSRISFDMNDEAEIYQLNYTKTFANTIQAKVGGYLEQRDRRFFSRSFQIVSGPNLSSFGESKQPWIDIINPLFNQFNSDGSGVVLKADNAAGDYGFDDNIQAIYGLVKIPLLDDKLKINMGLRYEWNERKLFDGEGNRIFAISNNINGVRTDIPLTNQIQDFYLPSINVNYNFSDYIVLRAAYGKTIDRPEYREQSSFRFTDVEGLREIYGNPLLINAEINNYDLRLEYYPSATEFLAIGGFYKHLTNATEKYISSVGSFEAPTVKFFNTQKASVYGIELEVRKNLGSLHPWFKDINLIANGAWLSSESERTLDQYGKPLDPSIIIPPRPMQGIAPYIINAGLYYGQPDAATKFSIVYNVFGNKLREAEEVNYGALYEMPRNMLDVTFSQQLLKNLQLRAGAQNILNAPFRFFRDQNRNQTFDPGLKNALEVKNETNNLLRGDFMENTYKIGTYFSLGFYANF